MKILIVGAGAVGQVYGRHLAMGGAEVWYLVKAGQAAAAGQADATGHVDAAGQAAAARHVETAAPGFVLYDLRTSRQPPPITFHPAGVLTTAAEVARQSWNQAWLCISSPALRGPWLDPFLSAIGGATLVNMAPGLDDADYLKPRFPATKTIQGVISLIAWQTPMRTETRPEPGIAYWLPPLSASLFDGPTETHETMTDIVTTLSRGGCPARRHRDTAHVGALASATMLPIIRGIELEGWSLSRFSRSRRAVVAAQAAREAMTLVARVSGQRIPWSRHLVRAPIVKAAMTLAPHLVPFDLEVYLQHHFTKVGDQTRQMLGAYVAHGRALGCPVTALENLSL